MILSDSGASIDFLHCDYCGSSIGVYDPFCWKRPDGTVTETAFLEIRDEPDGKHPESRFFHPPCLRAATGTVF